MTADSSKTIHLRISICCIETAIIMHVVLQNNFAQSAVSSNRLKEPTPAGLGDGIWNLD